MNLVECPQKNTAIPANKRGALFNYCPCDRTNFPLIVTLIQAKVKPAQSVPPSLEAVEII